MEIGDKTSWITTRDANSHEVADALALKSRRRMRWSAGTSAAHEYGVYIARPVAEWLIAHSRDDLPTQIDATHPDFPDWLRALGDEIGDFDYFATDRVGESHAWASVESGDIARAYCYIGERREVPLHIGEPTEIELELGVGHRWLEEGWQEWREPEWSVWLAAMPNESHVMRIARQWSICPLEIPDESVTGVGIYGYPPRVLAP